MLDWAQTEDVGFSYFISLGNLLDVGFADTIDYLASDDQTDALILYVESIAHARDFLSAARLYAPQADRGAQGRAIYERRKRRPVTRERWPARTPVTKPPFARRDGARQRQRSALRLRQLLARCGARAGRAWQSSPMPAVRPSWLPTH